MLLTDCKEWHTLHAAKAEYTCKYLHHYLSGRPVVAMCQTWPLN